MVVGVLSNIVQVVMFATFETVRYGPYWSEMQ